MRGRVVLLLAVAVALGFAPAPLPRKSRDRDDQEKVKRLYASLGGLWRPADDAAPLNTLWLHRGEKAAVADGWRLVLRFVDTPAEKFEGAPARVEADGEALRIVLPSASAEQRHSTHTLVIYAAEERVYVRVMGGPFARTYALVKARPKL